MSPSPTRSLFCGAVLAFGVARAFTDPAGQALPLFVPAERLPRAIAWDSSARQVAIFAGPALGGLAYALDPAVARGICAAAFLSAMVGWRRSADVRRPVQRARL